MWGNTKVKHQSDKLVHTIGPSCFRQLCLVDALLPITPLHYPLAFLIHKSTNKLSLPGLIVGSMFPDLEIPVIIVFFRNIYPYNRLVFHSLTGALTLGTVLSTFFTLVIYPILVKLLFHTKKEYFPAKIVLSANLLVSCLVGNLSRVLLDVVTHQSNPILWPFQTTTSSPAFTGQSSLLVHLFSAALLFLIIIENRRSSVKTLLLDEENFSAK